MLIASGFSTNCWFRSRRIAERRARRGPARGDGSADLPLPHIHGLTAALSCAELVEVEGAAALVGPSMPPDALTGQRGAGALADPVVASSYDGADAVLTEVERRCAERGDTRLVVACGPGEPMLDDLLDERGYTRPLDWYLLQW